jgi:hypothetical protein
MIVKPGGSRIPVRFYADATGRKEVGTNRTATRRPSAGRALQMIALILTSWQAELPRKSSNDLPYG